MLINGIQLNSFNYTNRTNFGRKGVLPTAAREGSNKSKIPFSLRPLLHAKGADTKATTLEDRIYNELYDVVKGIRRGDNFPNYYAGRFEAIFGKYYEKHPEELKEALIRDDEKGKKPLSYVMKYSKDDIRVKTCHLFGGADKVTELTGEK